MVIVHRVQMRTGKSIAVDCSGNVYVAACVCWFTNGGYNYTTIKYDSSGTQQWYAVYNGPALGMNKTDQPVKMAIDNFQNVYVTGYSMGDTTYNDIATVKYNSSGIQQWVARYNGPGNRGDSATGLAIDNFGNVLVTGASWGGDSTGYDFVTIKYNSLGEQQWVSRHNGTNSGKIYCHIYRN